MILVKSFDFKASIISATVLKITSLFKKHFTISAGVSQAQIAKRVINGIEIFD